jgi:hypothetical protein
MQRTWIVVALGAALMTAALDAQTYTPTPKPSASAASRDWFQDRQPIFFAGDLYYPAGARYHFDPNVMVQTGDYDGIPLYADTTATPYDEVLVPIGGGLVQPYQRLRVGALSGTTGSHAPNVHSLAAQGGLTPPRHPSPADVEPQVMRTRELDEETRQRLLQPPGRIQTVVAPLDNRGIWITYEGQRWNAAGETVANQPGRFSRIGEYFGFPVFSAAGREEIFLPAAHGLLAA